MGSSSRPKYSRKQTGEEADKYCIDFMENWRKCMDNLTGFILVGHSYGGYICGTYASHYPQHIEKLVLLSPLGLKFKPQDFDIDNLRFSDGKALSSWEKILYSTLWGRFTPFSIYRKSSEARVRKSLIKYVKQS